MDDSKPRQLPVVRPLPCFPCPHNSRCGSRGTALFDDEAGTIRRLFGDDALVWSVEDGDWRTSAPNGKCYFLGDNRCKVHEEPYYPRVCRGFPWTDAITGGDYPWDRTICPEFKAE